MPRGAISPGQAARTQLQLIAATTVKAQLDTITLQAQVSEAQQAVEGIDIEAVTTRLNDYGRRLNSLEEQP